VRLLAVMVGIARLLVAAFTPLFMSRCRLQAEILLLRHQLNVLRRAAPRRVRPGNTDRLLFVWLYRFWPGILRSAVIVRPETIVRWHRAGFRAFWRWKSRPKIGRPATPAETRGLIRQISAANPLWGAPRIHGELLKLGVEVAQSTVAKYMPKRRRPPGQTWRSFLCNQVSGIASVDLFIVPTITFKLLFGVVVLRYDRRRLVSIGVTDHPTAAWLAQQMQDAFPWEEAPRHLIHDRDRSSGGSFKRRLRAMGIRDHPTAPRCPWQNGYVERLIGSIRRECLDHVVMINDTHLRRVLRDYAHYYDRARTHLSIAKDTPEHRPICQRGTIVSVPHLGGLHHSFVRI
jgi:transposase InsO family protein